MTPEQADARSEARAERNARRLTGMGVVVMLLLFILAGILQRQQVQLERVVEQLRREAVADRAASLAMCDNRRENTLKVNNAWDSLANIERGNTSVTAEIRERRVTAYQYAKLEVPECPR